MLQGTGETDQLSVLPGAGQAEMVPFIDPAATEHHADTARHAGGLRARLPGVLLPTRTVAENRVHALIR